MRLNLNRIGGVLDHPSSSRQNSVVDPVVDELQQQASQGTPRAIARWLIQRHRALALTYWRRKKVAVSISS